MKAPRGGSTIRQMAYARRVFGGKGKCKKEIALDVGFSTNVSNSVASHIENTEGFHNAMKKLAVDSNNLALAAMEEFKARGFKKFTNGELTNALNAIGSAWSRFNNENRQKDNPNGGNTNRLRTVILQQIENQTMQTNTTQPVEVKKVIDIEEVKKDDPNDF
jgi:hypothetical protein